MSRFAYFDRLTAEEQRSYLRSDAVRVVELVRIVPLRPLAEAISGALAAGDRQAVEATSQELVDAITNHLVVARTVVLVRSVRPSNDAGALHGLYAAAADASPASITMWMRTAEKRRVVAFKTFLRELLHELCHHLDVELYRLEHSLHTHGFYARESSLVRQVLEERSAPS